MWVGILAGLRRGEIARLDRMDISPAYITVKKGKTGRRQVPMSTALYNELQRFRGNPLTFGVYPQNITREQQKRRNEWLTAYRASGRVVPWPVTPGGWQIAAKRLTEKFLPQLLPRIYGKEPEKFGWNPFRHTFASRHVQAGIPLSLVAAWLGDTEKTALAHYARFVPKNMKDTRIDKADPIMAEIAV